MITKVIESIILQYDKARSRSIKEEHLNYKNQFEIAKKNNEKLKLKIPEFIPNQTFKSYEQESKTVRNDIKEIIHNEVYCYPQEMLALNCFDFAKLTSQKLKEYLGISSVVTIGSPIDNRKNSRLFFESLLLLKYRKWNKNFRTKGINLHAWIPLPDFFIIDITLLAALKYFNLYPEKDYRSFYYVHESMNRQGHFSYQPILLGTEYLNQIDLKSIFHATSVEELKNNSWN